MMKTDKRGRLRYTQEQKKTMVEAYQASGLSAPRVAEPDPENQASRSGPLQLIHAKYYSGLLDTNMTNADRDTD